MAIAPEQDLTVRAWLAAKRNLTLAATDEAAARKTMIALCYPQHQPGSELDGTHNVDLGNGYRLKGVFATGYTVTKEALPDVLLELAAAGEGGEHAADSLFKYKPELSVSVYKNLMPSIKAIADKCIVSKPSSPQFEIVEPKAKAE